jgi:CDP-paratose 2-epimerase
MLRVAQRPKYEVLITGGAGFIGANLAARLLASTDAHLTLFDNLAEPGSAQNFAWLSAQAGEGRLKLMCSDLRRASRVAEAVCRADEIYHMAPMTVETTILTRSRARTWWAHQMCLKRRDVRTANPQ